MIDIKAIQETFKDYPDMLPKLLDLLKKELPLLSTDLQLAFKNKNIKALQATAHKIRGTSGCCHAKNLHKAAADFENFLETTPDFKKVTIITKHYQRLLKEIEAVEKDLAVYFKD